MTFILWTLIFIFALFLIVKKVQNDKKNGNLNLPPGPWGLPLLGHLVSLGLNPHLTLIKWKRKFGPIIHIRFGSFPTVVLCDSKVIKEAYNMAEFSGRPALESWTGSGMRGLKGIIFSEGVYNTELRAFGIRKLKEFGIVRQARTLEDRIHEGISEFMDFIKMRKGLPIKSGGIPSAHFIRTLWSLMVRDELNPQEVEQLTRKVEKLTVLGPVLSELAGLMPWLEKGARILSFGHFSLIAARSRPITEFYSFFPKFLNKKEMHLAKGQSPGQSSGQVATDIMDLFLKKVEETTDESSPFHASHGAATYFLADLFGAGIHTTYITLLWMLNFMAKNPEVQKKLQAEIDEVTGSENDLSRLPSLADRDKMPYADGVVHEVLRMSSVVPLGVPRKTTEDVCFHGYDIKKDTMIFANTYGIHHDPEIWGDPHNFRPERWFGEQGKKLKSEHFLPFSTGRRICPGETLTREQLFLYTTTLFQNYSVGFSGKNVIKGVFGITLHPSKFTVVFNQRKADNINKS